MEKAELPSKDPKSSVRLKGISLGERMPKEITSPMRRRLSDITNLSKHGFSVRLVNIGKENGKTAINADDYISKLLKENNSLVMSLAERNTELQKLGFMLTKTSQQNWLLAKANTDMLAELNLTKDRLKAVQHELGCTSASLRIKIMELEEEKKFNKQNNLPQEIRPKGHMKPVETVAGASHQSSHKKTRPPNRKRTQRSLGPMSTVNQETTKEMDEKRRKSTRRKSVCMKVESCEPSEDLFGTEDGKLQTKSKHEENSLQPIFLPPNTPNLNAVKVEVEEYPSSSSQHQTKVTRSLGRPLRKAAEKVSSYKEMPLTAKLRRPE